MQMIKKISIITIILFLNACLFKNNKDYFMFSEKIYLKNGKINLKKYLGKNPEIIKNNDDIFVISISKNLIKISLTTAKIDWIKSINTVPENNFVFDENYVYFNGINNNFYILNYNTGEIEYIYINSNSNMINNVKKPILYKNLVIAFFNDYKIVILDKASKKILFDENYTKESSVKIENNLLNIGEKIINLDNFKN